MPNIKARAGTNTSLGSQCLYGLCEHSKQNLSYIAKEIGVAHQTVRSWSLGYYTPRGEYRDMLQRLVGIPVGVWEREQVDPMDARRMSIEDSDLIWLMLGVTKTQIDAAKQVFGGRLYGGE